MYRWTRRRTDDHTTEEVMFGAEINSRVIGNRLISKILHFSLENWDKIDTF